MIEAVEPSSTDIFEAVIALSRSIAGRSDLESLLSGVGESVRRIVGFDYVGLSLYDSKRDRMQGHFLSEMGTPAASLCFAVDQDPAGWVWKNQRPLVLTSLDAETRWPVFRDRARNAGANALILVPLTAGASRLGAFGFTCATPHKPSTAELGFLERVASEFAVAVEAFLARQEAVRDRDRLRTLFDITNALVSKLSADDLFAAISEQLSKVIRHDFAALMLRNEGTSGLDVFALHFTGPRLFEKTPHVDPAGMPSADALETGRPVVVYDTQAQDRYPSPEYRRVVELGCKSACSVPLVTSNGTLGTLEIARITGDDWTDDDIDFLTLVARQVAVAVENALSYRQLEEIKERLATEKLYLEDEIRLDHNIANMVGEGPAFQSVLKRIQIVAPTDATVLITGETGTGKELVARAIHELSSRSKRSFVKVNCAAIPASLLESELFGHEKGSFTGAVAQKIGRFELAHEGTLFLDEIGEMPLELQPKLLRAIQDQEFERIGGTRTIRTNVRFVAATNRNLKAMVDENKFRADLYYRLHVFPLEVPPLRERREDIPLLTRYFVQKHAHRIGRDINAIPTQVLDALTKYDWPGNIRELQNLLERSVILSSGPELNVAMPEGALVSLNGRASSTPDAAERARILRALKDANGKVSGPTGAAARLGLKRTTLQSRMRKYNIGRQYQ